MTVNAGTGGPMTTVTIDRPATRNAADGPTATAPLQAFVAFERGASDTV